MYDALNAEVLTATLSMQLPSVFKGALPGKSVVSYSGCPKCVHTQTLKLKFLLDVICCKQRQSAS